MFNVKLVYFLITCAIATSIAAASFPTIYSWFGIRLASQSALNFQLLYSIPLACTVMLVYGIFYGVNWKNPQRTKGVLPKPFKPYPSKNTIASVGRAYDLQKKLYERLQGDRAAAHRLVNNLKAKNPGKPEDWYWQRAIDQLERDRY